MERRHTRYRLMASLLKLVDRYEYDDITVSMISRECGISRQAFYKIFSSKQDLSVQMIITLFRDCLKGQESFDWEQLVRAYVQQMDRFMEFFHSMVSESNYLISASAIFSHLNDLTEAMIKHRTGRAPDEDLASVMQCYNLGITYSYMVVLGRGLHPDVPLVIRRLRMSMPDALAKHLLGFDFPASVQRDVFPGRDNDGLEHISAFLNG